MLLLPLISDLGCSAHAEQPREGSLLCHWEKVLLLLQHWVRFHWHFFILWENFEGGEMEHWPSFCRTTLGRAGRWDLYLRRISAEGLFYLLASVCLYCFASSFPSNEAWSRPHLASHYPHFFTCFARNLYVIMPIWKAEIFRPLYFLLALQISF